MLVLLPLGGNGTGTALASHEESQYGGWGVSPSVPHDWSTSTHNFTERTMGAPNENQSGAKNWYLVAAVFKDGGWSRTCGYTGPISTGGSGGTASINWSINRERTCDGVSGPVDRWELLIDVGDGPFYDPRDHGDDESKFFKAWEWVREGAGPDPTIQPAIPAHCSAQRAVAGWADGKLTVLWHAEGRVLTFRQAAAYAYAGGFRGEALATATAVMRAESAFDRYALNGDGNNPPESWDRGIWQINNHWHPTVSDTQAFDPLAASEYAYDISGGGSDFSPWVAYTNGAYQSFMGAAAEAAAAVETSGGTSEGRDPSGVNGWNVGWSGGSRFVAGSPALEPVGVYGFRLHSVVEAPATVTIQETGVACITEVMVGESTEITPTSPGDDGQAFEERDCSGWNPVCWFTPSAATRASMESTRSELLGTIPISYVVEAIEWWDAATSRISGLDPVQPPTGLGWSLDSVLEGQSLDVLGADTRRSDGGDGAPCWGSVDPDGVDCRPATGTALSVLHGVRGWLVPLMYAIVILPVAFWLLRRMTPVGSGE